MNLTTSSYRNVIMDEHIITVFPTNSLRCRNTERVPASAIHVNRQALSDALQRATEATLDSRETPLGDEIHPVWL